MRDIGKNIKLFRTQKNMTQDELAEKLFVTRQTVSNYEIGKSRPDVDMLVKIAEVLETDVQTVIYGPQPAVQNRELRRLIIGGSLTAALLLLWVILAPIVKEHRELTYSSGYSIMMSALLRPLIFLFAGWTLAQLLGMALKKKPLDGIWYRRVRILLTAVTVIWFMLSLWYTGAIALNEWLFENHIRGEWVDVEGINVASQAWSMLPPPIPEWLSWIGNLIFLLIYRNGSWLFTLLGGALWLFGFPKSTKE